MVNLENEIGVINSFRIHKNVSSALKSNVKFYSVGRIKKNENHPDEWFKNYNIEYKYDTDLINEYSYYEIEVKLSSGLAISHYDYNDELIKSYSFNSYSTFDKQHDLIFNLEINDQIKENLKK